MEIMTSMIDTAAVCAPAGNSGLSLCLKDACMLTLGAFERHAEDEARISTVNLVPYLTL